MKKKHALCMVKAIFLKKLKRWYKFVFHAPFIVLYERVYNYLYKTFPFSAITESVVIAIFALAFKPEKCI